MKNLCIISVWAAVCSLFIFAAGAMHAQVIDGDACSDACEQQQSVCVEACGRHSDPVECESSCQDSIQDCLDRCPM